MIEQIRENAKNLLNSINELVNSESVKDNQDYKFLSDLKEELGSKASELEQRVQTLSDQLDVIEEARDTAEELLTQVEDLVEDIENVL